VETWIGIVLIVFAVNIVSLFVSDKKIRVMSIFLLIFVTVISAFRADIGEDYSGYIGWFFSCNIEKSILPYPELSFQILSTVIQNIGLSYQVMFMFYSIGISMMLWMAAKKYSKNNRNILIFISLWVLGAFDIGWWYSMNVIRQYLAISIILYSYKFIIHKEYKKYFMACMCATFIHSSAAVLLIVPFIIDFDINKKKCISVVALAVIFSFSSLRNSWMITLISAVGIYDGYIDFLVSDTYKGFGFSSYFFLIQFLFLIKYLRWDNRGENVVGILITIATVLKFIMVRPFSRITAYFSVTFIIAWIFIFEGNYIKKKSVALICMFVIYAVTFLYDINATILGHAADWRPSAGNIKYDINVDIFDSRRPY
jgi:hypothetical protein